MSDMQTFPAALPAQDEIHVFPLNFNELEGLADRFRLFLSAAEKGRADRIQNEKLRQNFVTVHGALRCLLGNYLGMPAQDVPIDLGEHGKPFTKGLEFSLSHAHHLAILAFTRQSPVGVDVEILDRGTVLEQVASLAFSAQEYAEWLMLPHEVRLQAFFHIWTCKEALLKALGTGMHFSPRKFSVRVDPDEQPCLLRMDDLVYASVMDHAQIYHLEAGAGAVAALAVLGDGSFRMGMYFPTAGDWEKRIKSLI